MTPLLQALEIIWSDLPILVGVRWGSVQRQLAELIADARLERRPLRAVEADVWRVLQPYPAARQRLTSVLEQLMDEGEVVALDFPDVSIRGSTRWRGIEPRSLPPSITATTVTRYPDISCPRRVWVKTPRLSAIVRLTQAISAFSDTEPTSFAVRANEAVTVRLDAPGFDHLNATEQSTAIFADRDSPPLVFDLKPLQVGDTHLIFNFAQDGNPIGTISLPITISARESTAEPADVQGIITAGQPTTAPDFTLYITYESGLQPHRLRFTLVRAGEVGRTFQSIELRGDPKAETDALYRQLNILSWRNDPTDPAAILEGPAAMRELRKLGLNLWASFIPSDLKAVYEAEKTQWRDKTLLIVSDEAHFPWELLWPHGDEWDDEFPLCMTMKVTRWLRRDAQGNGHEQPDPTLPWQAGAAFVPTDSELPAAQTELTFLRDLMRRENQEDLTPAIASKEELIARLEQGGYDWLHIAAHGEFITPAEGGDSTIRLQDNGGFTPTDIVGSAILRPIRVRRPAFFFNVCEGGRNTMALTGLAGFANRLISAGAGLFIAPLWKVNDEVALQFAQAFYTAFFDGATIAEATRQARRAAYAFANDDPAWLAYSVYGHPNGQRV